MKIIYSDKAKSDNETIKYAISELQKYLNKMEIDTNNLEIELLVSNEFKVENTKLDDCIEIKFLNKKGFIKGSNERSILIGVYRFLYKLGCRWIRPTELGEIIPKADINIQIDLYEIANLRHRGVVIEGANSCQNVIDMIEWLPKLGYNSYFIQFKNAYTFFDKWYNHTNNPTLVSQEFNSNIADEYVKRIESELKKRDLIYHAVGHGWTGDCIGIVTLGWDLIEYKLKDWQKELLAQINNKRELFHNVPMNTNLCYSNPKVQNMMVDHITDYLKANNQIDMLHVWLADEFNNHCECEECQKNSPSDLYIQILNLLDIKLSQNNINTKIVLLLYNELLWPPQHEKLNNQNRFLYMFAPISRVFSKSYKDLKTEKINPIPKYIRNKITVPKQINENIAFLKEWQKVLDCDSFDFDYHLGRAHYGDLGYYNISKIIYDDIHSLKDLKLNGLLSCQQQRSFFPTALPNYIMGNSLWNDKLSFEQIEEDYFKSAFGKDGIVVRDYLKALSNLCDIDYWHARKEWYNPKLSTTFLNVEKVVNEFKPIIQQHLITETSNVVHKSWEYLDLHSTYSILFAQTMAEKANGNNNEANKKWTEFVHYIRSIELKVQNVLDVYRIIQIANTFVKLKVDE